VLAGCKSTNPDSGTSGTSNGTDTAFKGGFFDSVEFDRQLAQREVIPEGDPARPWLQAIEPDYVDTTRYAKPGDWQVCFSNAGVGNPWRVTGLTTLKAEQKLHPKIKSLTIVDAEGEDEKQITDISDLLTKGCDALIISPNTTAALTPAVEKACQSGIPVIVFDRGVDTRCPITFVHSIGGYAFGATAAEFIADKVGTGGRVLALRILPGVDVLEHRWAAAKRIFEEQNVEIVGVEFTDGDPAKTKTIVSDHLERGKVDGVWMDAGATTVAVVEAFEDAGLPIPPVTGEDQQDFLELWQQRKLTAIAPTYPVYMWRTALIAATYVLSGTKVPADWVLPQPIVTDRTLAEYVRPGMPALFYPTCGCQQMPGFPQAWGGR